ncbi:MAG: SUF system Fe-S cluster assembly regulator [Burkholderiales bacterium]|nr:SUF system Fe-S cluster assembly regulator [Burkholderiales bacterium]MDQ3195819.1 SUF system Fe-S cluster assembly regulator [Pseudomonadota bacterium]
MLRMSKMADYGTVVMTAMARSPDRVHSAGDLAAQVHLPAPTVSKILKMLARHELLESVRGAKGGYTLARPPAAITVAEIIDAMEGPIAITECSSAASACEQEGSCSVRANWRTINRAIRSALNDVSLAEMVHPRLHAVDFGALRARRMEAKC